MKVILITLGLALGLSLLLHLVLFRRRYIRMRQILAVVQEWVQGRLERKVPDQPRDAMGKMGGLLNQIAVRLEANRSDISEERARLQAILSGMVEGVLVLDCRGTILMVNTALNRMFHLQGEEAVGRPALEVLRHYPLIEMIKIVLDTRRSQSQELTLQSPIERSFQVHASAERDCRVGEVCSVLVFHDITELKRLERVRKDFVANVSHELKTPLTSIKGYLEALLDGAKEDPQKSTEFLEIIQKHADNLQATLSDLLQLSAIESGQHPWKREPVDLSDLMTRCERLFRPAAEKKGQSLQIRIEAGLPAVFGDADRLTQVLINLLDNAIKYTPEGGEIRFDANQTDASVQIRVTDTGLGIPKTELPRIFERFYRVDRARSRELGGTGLGLSIVKHIVEAHHGSIEVDSIVGKGSRFSVTLPKHPDPSQ